MCSTSLLTMCTVAALQLNFNNGERNFNPGAGIDVEGPGDTVHKDGYTHVECLQDEMYEEADKYGENAVKYSNKFEVSIVRYADKVDREKARPMTPQVCFDFCRTIDDMHFFGLTHGRDCYCTPYYERKTSGGGVCDLPCDGDSAKMCGGQEMMNMYEMHMCANTAEDIEKAAEAGSMAHSMASGAGTWGQKAAGIFEAAVDTLMLEANKVGDMNSHDLAQQMKVHAGTVLHAAEKASAAGTALQDALTELSSMAHADFSVPDNIYKAEASIREVNKLAGKATEDGKKSFEINAAFYPAIDAAHAFEGAGLFVNAMEMIKRWGDAEVENATHAVRYPTTCAGELAAEPLVGLSQSECAEACNVLAPSSDDNYCVAFQHFVMGDIDLYPAGSTTTDECEDYLSPYGSYYYYFSCSHIYDLNQERAVFAKERCEYELNDGTPVTDEGCVQYYLPWAEYYFGEVGAETCGRFGYYHYWELPEDDEAWDDFSYSNSRPNTSPGYPRASEACCSCGGGKQKKAARPSTGLCVLFKSVEHVHKYDCGEPADSECVDVKYGDFMYERYAREDYYDWFAFMDGTCQRMADDPDGAAGYVYSYYLNDGDFNDYYDTTDAPNLKEGCCSVKAMFPDGKWTGEVPSWAQAQANSTRTRVPVVQKEKAPPRKKSTTALLGKAARKSKARTHHRHGPVEDKKRDPVFTAPPGLTTPNVCMVRASWMIAAPRKPEFDKLNTCLDTGSLVMPEKK